MTEPVAYLVSQEPLSSVRWLSDVKPIGVDDKQITPLYTKEQLHPQVKMTRDQKENLLMIRDNQEPIVELISVFDEGVLIHDFDPYWKPLTEKQVVQAWLNPETIVVTDSE